MKNRNGMLMSVADFQADLAKAPETLFAVAGDERLLARLPRGNWVGSVRAAVALAFAAAGASACARDVSGPGPQVQAAILPSPPGSPMTVVTISGAVTIPGFTTQVRAQAAGTAAALTGLGSDSPGKPPGVVPPGYCRFPLTGSVASGVVTLRGTVTFSNDPSLVGTTVTITADASTGGITFVFGTLTLMGTGSVVVAHP